MDASALNLYDIAINTILLAAAKRYPEASSHNMRIQANRCFYYSVTVAALLRVLPG